MDIQTQAQIYLADQRASSETDFFRSYHLFNFGSYSVEDRRPFGPLQLLNDDTLRAGASLTMRVEENTDVILLPVVGGLEYKRDGGAGSPTTDFLEPGQVQVLSLTAGMSYTVSNPYETEYINFLQLWLTNTSGNAPINSSQTRFNLTHKNTLLPLFALTHAERFTGSVCRGFIGQYDGRQEGIYHLTKPVAGSGANGIFVFVLKGVFEVANRLLHEKDGLALRHVQNDEVEFEALSNDALLILVELPLEN